MRLPAIAAIALVLAAVAAILSAPELFGSSPERARVSLGGERTIPAHARPLSMHYEAPKLVESELAETEISSGSRVPVAVDAEVESAEAYEEVADPCSELRDQVEHLLKLLEQTPDELRREAFSSAEMGTFFEMEMSAMAEAVIAGKDRLQIPNDYYDIDFSSQGELTCWWIPDYGSNYVGGPPQSVKLLVWDPQVGYPQESVLGPSEHARWVMLYAGLHRSENGSYPAAYFSRY